jgi:hypothetical protein
MQSTSLLANQLQQINNSFIQSSFYDPTTYYLGGTVFDRDEFKRLKKEGLIEISSEDHFGRKYILSSKGREFINRAN